MVWAAGVVLLVAVAALAVSSVLITGAYREEARQRREAEVRREQAEESLAEARAVQDFLNNDLLGQADLARQEPGADGRDPDITVRELLDRAAEAVGQKFRDRPRVEASVRLTIGDP